MIKAQSGSNYLDWAAQGLQCSDCTPYLEGQIHYEKSLNLFSMGVRQVSSFLDEPRWWSKGVSALKQAEESISRALVCLERGCAQERMMIVLRFMTNLLTASAPNLDDIYVCISISSSFSCFIMNPTVRGI
ncbi:hypothetical protein SISNIDRAFT_353342 [Sistotremastrum niveocremeum HHB9708]|uniref:Uncharacterized protein n=1 Tax=Sistotremastrum niveocremeum HHB9708 TaxID=1314777 RepID=A0A164X5G0_9AGAM|nr:hypothetical protein SISNIDRAFT_353342 [Sistotremastrum niveocremeum HHB9708]